MDKIQLSNKRIIKDVTTVWYEHGPEVDIVMDLKKLTFAPGSLEEIYTFHVLDHIFPNEVKDIIANWKNCLKKGGKLIVVADDFDFLSRAYIGGDFSIDFYNENFTHPMYFNRESLCQVLADAGFPEKEIVIWFQDVVREGVTIIPKAQHEIIFQAQL